MAGAGAPRLAISGQPCLNPKKKKSPKYETRHPMKPAAFRYHAPKTVDEAVALLAEVAAEDGRVLAGGQSLVPIMAFRLARPGHLVDINGVDSLNQLAATGGKLQIGACVRQAAFYCPGPGAPRRQLPSPG